VIGRGSRGVVYEATQLGLDRRVAFKLFAPDPRLAERFRHLEWPEHRHAATMYAAGVCEQGEFVAMQLVRGPTLAELWEVGRLEPGRAAGLLDDVAIALDAAHAAGITHGSVRAENVFVDRDGRALLSDFGVGDESATPTSDRIAFAALLTECLGQDSLPITNPASRSAVSMVRSASEALEVAPPGSPSSRPRRRLRPAAALAAVGLGAAVAIAVIVKGSEPEPEPAPPVPQRVTVLGSELPPAPITTVDCDGEPPSGASQACTVVQTALPGRQVVARRDGVIRSWAVRGASGELALQVVHRRGNRYSLRARSEDVFIPDGGIHLLQADLPVRAGDLVGIEVTPGAGIGVRAPAPGATTARWFGPLLLGGRRPDRGSNTGLDDELMLRVDYEPGAEWTPPGLLVGPGAENARSGRKLGARRVEIGGGRVRTITVVSLPEAIAVDLFDGRRRVARLVVSDFDPRGRLVDVIGYGRPLLRVAWLNPDGRVIRHDYSIGADSLVARN
jgi:hypothetical protein